jgi:hypothetical protein
MLEVWCNEHVLKKKKRKRRKNTLSSREQRSEKLVVEVSIDIYHQVLWKQLHKEVNHTHTHTHTHTTVHCLSKTTLS